MKRFLAVAICAILSITFMSAAKQERGEIRGKIIDRETGEPIGWATVALLGQDSTLVCGTACDADGLYSLQAAPGHYILSVSFIGYKDSSTGIELGCGLTNAGTTGLESESQSITGAVVTERIKLVEMKMDKLVMNVSQSAFAQGSDAMELIRKAPGVTVDKDGNIKLNGKAVTIWIDGRPSGMNGQALESLLRGTRGDTIEKFEIMEHPSAKYDAEGQGGIINIKTKRNALSGLNGSIGTDNGGMYFRNIDRAYWQTDSHANLNYRSKSTNTYLNLNGSLYQTGIDMKVKNDLEQAAGMYSQISRSLICSDWRTLQAKLGNDWFIDDKNTFGVIVSVPVIKFGMPSGRKDNRTEQSMNGILTDMSESEIKSSNRTTQVNANVNWTHIFDAAKGSEMTVNADWYRTDGSTKNLQGTYSRATEAEDWMESRRDIISDNSIDIYSAKIDYQSAVFGKAMLETGGKWALSRTGNDMTRNETGQEPFNSRTAFDYREHIGAAYLSMAMQMSAKWSMKAGLRGEYTNSYGDWKSENSSTRRSYFDVFPTLYLGYVPSEKWRLSMSYTRRITRPDYDRLNPVEIYIDSHNCIVGDPDIKPEYNDGITLQAGFRQHLSWSVGYNFTNGLMDQRPVFKENGDERLVWGNFGRRHIASAGLNVTELPVVRWLLWTASANGMYIRNMGEGNYVNGKPFANIYTCLTFVIPKDWKIQLDGYAASRMSWGYFRIHPQFFSNLAVKKNLLSDRMTLSVNISDLFRTMRTNLDLVNVQGVSSSFIGQKYYAQKVRVGLSWNFGKAHQTRARKVGDLEEASRIGNSGGIGGGNQGK